ncbi:hypothetical protein Tdes44962_MAKER09358, partial [Teratosphaeria destructans]
MDFDPTLAGPGPTPTTAHFNPHHHVLHTPKTAAFPSHFHDAFRTPQMHAGYATPQQPQYALMSPMHAPPPTSSEDTARSDHHAHVQANGPPAMHPPPPPQQQQQGGGRQQQAIISPGPAHGFQPSPMMHNGHHGSFDAHQMQTPPPTRGTSCKKSQPPAQVAFGTPSTIASRRLMQTPQQPAVPGNLAADQQHTPVHFPPLQFSPDMYQYTHLGPASAPVMPQTQLLWAQMQSPDVTVQPSPLGDPFGSSTTPQTQWPTPSPVPHEMAQTPPFHTPAMTSFSVQPPHPRPASAVPLAPSPHLVLAPPTTSASLDPSLIYSSPVRPIVRSSSRSSKAKPPSLAAGSKRNDGVSTSQQPRDSTSPTTSIPDLSGPGLRRSHTTGTTRAHPVQPSRRSAEPLSRSNSVTQVPRTTSPLKRMGRTPLGRISEHHPKRASVILTVDENGMARTQTVGAEPESPTRSIRNRYPGLFDSDTEEDDSDTNDEPPSRSTSFAFARHDQRRSKAARLDPPVENLEGIDLPRSSSRASSQGVTPSRAAMAAAAQLRKQSSVRRTSRNASTKRNPMTGATAPLTSVVDSAPMEIGLESPQAQAVALRSTTRAHVHPHPDWPTITAARPKQPDLPSPPDWPALSFDHPSMTPHHPGPYVGGFRPAYSPMQPPPMLIRCICGVDTDRGQTMVQCASCTQWLHGGCIEGDAARPSPRGYTCFLCTKPTLLLQAVSYVESALLYLEISPMFDFLTPTHPSSTHARRPSTTVLSHYKQLTRADIAALAPIFSTPSPSHLIAALPRHLKTPHPPPSPSPCPLHTPLHTPLLSSLWRAILRKVNREMQTIVACPGRGRRAAGRAAS